VGLSINGPVPDNLGLGANATFSGSIFKEQVVGTTLLPNAQASNGDFVVGENVARISGNAGGFAQTNNIVRGNTLFDMVGFKNPQPNQTESFCNRQTFTVTLFPGSTSFVLTTVITQQASIINGRLVSSSVSVIRP
jgi:hypothetical protein